MRRGLLAAAAFAAGAAGAAPETYQVESGHTFPHFAVSHLGISTAQGRFDHTRGRIALDREKGEGTLEIEIDAASVSTGNPKLDAVIRGDDFLDAEHHPTIAFRSARFETGGDGPVRVAGELTLRGVTRPVELRVARIECTRKPLLVILTCGADATAAFSRAAFGISSFASFVGDEVRVVIEVEAVRQEPPRDPATPQGG